MYVYVYTCCVYDQWIGYYSGVLPREPMPSTITVRLPSSADLDAYASEQWEVQYIPFNLASF